MSAIHLKKDNYLEQLNDMQLLQRLLDSFSTITKMYVAVTDVKGSIIISSSKGIQISAN